MSAPGRIVTGSLFAMRDVPDATRRETIQRRQTCSCGREYTQFLLGERFMQMAERQSKAALQHVTTQIPGLWVPVECPRCEHRELSRYVATPESWALPAPRRLQDRRRFARNMAELCAAWNRPMDDETSAVYWRALERSMSDDDFERGVLTAVRTERKWPTPTVIFDYGRAKP